MHNLCLWQPDQERIQQSNLQHFMAEVNRFHGLQLHSYAQLYQWSVEDNPFLAAGVAALRRQGRARQHSGGEPPGDAAYPLVPGQPTQLRRKPAAPPG